MEEGKPLVGIILGSDSDLAAHALANGQDILFTSADGTTKLDHQIEVFTTATGRLAAWVKVPILSASANTMLWISDADNARLYRRTSSMVPKKVALRSIHDPNAQLVDVPVSGGGFISPNSSNCPST